MVAAEEATDSLGFVVERHGWTFGNYAASGSGLFGVADAVALFGDSAVCVETQGECTSTPAAAEYEPHHYPAPPSGSYRPNAAQRPMT